eukprot:3681174-Prymnesium_polylepis.1
MCELRGCVRRATHIPDAGELRELFDRPRPLEHRDLAGVVRIRLTNDNKARRALNTWQLSTGGDLAGGDLVESSTMGRRAHL